MGLNPIFEMIALNVARDLRRAGCPSQWPMFTGPNGKGLPRAHPSHGKQCSPASSRGAPVEGMLENSRCRVQHGAWSRAVLLRCLLDPVRILRYRDKIRINFIFPLCARYKSGPWLKVASRWSSSIFVTRTWYSRNLERILQESCKRKIRN